jgi:hypothetical protein
MIDGWFQSRRIMRETLSTEMSCQGEVADVLPAGNLFEHQQADLVAGVEEVARLRVVRGAHDVAVQAVAQDVGVLALGAPASPGRRRGRSGAGRGRGV